jgi:hypothetical protein
MVRMCISHLLGTSSSHSLDDMIDASFRVPDQRGWQPSKEEIIKGAPSSLTTTLPIDHVGFTTGVDPFISICTIAQYACWCAMLVDITIACHIVCT